MSRFECVASTTEERIEIPTHGNRVGLLRIFLVIWPRGIGMDEKVAYELTGFFEANRDIFIFARAF